MTTDEKIGYAKERHAMAVAVRDFNEAAKWQEHLVELGAPVEIGIINNSMSGMFARLAKRLEESR